jgi:D-aspartate ligase
VIPHVAIIDGNRNGLASIRSLGRLGLKVICLDHSGFKPGQYSRYVWKRIRVPKPQHGQGAFVQALIDAAMQHGGKEKIYLLPVNDEYVRVLAEHWEVLKPYYKPLFETRVDRLETIGNKLRFSEAMGEIGIPQPRRLTSGEIHNKDLPFPIIVKPDARRSIQNLQKKVFKVRLCEDHDALRDAVQSLDDAGTEAIIQQFIPGGDDALYTAGIVAFQGKLIACFTGRKVRQFPPRAGQATLAEAVDHPKLMPYAQRMVEALNYTGIAQIEFKAYRDELYVIEMNPRSWSWHGLAQKVGVDLPALLFQAIHDQRFPEEIVLNQRHGAQWYFLLEDLVYNKWGASNVSWREIWRSVFTSEAFAFFDRRDPLPWIIHALHDYPLRAYMRLSNKKRNIDLEG